MNDKATVGDSTMGASHGIIAPLAKDLADSAALLARTTNEIQESIMKVRMVPIGQVFDRFPRLVRDVAKARGKEVQLVISGAETDLDKTIVEALAKGKQAILKASPQKGKPTTDTYSLAGFAQALAMIDKACGIKR